VIIEYPPPRSAIFCFVFLVGGGGAGGRRSARAAGALAETQPLRETQLRQLDDAVGLERGKDATNDAAAYVALYIRDADRGDRSGPGHQRDRKREGGDVAHMLFDRLLGGLPFAPHAHAV